MLAQQWCDEYDSLMQDESAEKTRWREIPSIAKEKIKNRYSGDPKRLGADLLTMVRVPGTEVVVHALANKRKDPKERSWGFALGVAAFLFTDKLDGWLGKRSKTPKDKLSYWGDQLVDKYAYGRIANQLVKNGEINKANLLVPLIRDVPVTVGRVALEGTGESTAAKNLGRAKMAVQCIGIVTACSPVEAAIPGLADKILWASTAMSVVSGVGYVKEAIPAFGQLLKNRFEGHKDDAEFVDEVADIVEDITGVDVRDMPSEYDAASD